MTHEEEARERVAGLIKWLDETADEEPDPGMRARLADWFHLELTRG